VRPGPGLARPRGADRMALGEASRLKVLPHSIEMFRDLLRVRAKVRRGTYGRRP